MIHAGGFSLAKEDRMEPSIGRIVHYILLGLDAEQINRRRVPGAGHNDDWPGGAQAHVGSIVTEGQKFPMIVTAVWTNITINGQVFLDGNDAFWVRSVQEGTTAGTWQWPERV